MKNLWGGYLVNIIKRNGLEEEFNSSKIIAAVSKANDTVPDDVKLTRHQMDVIADRVELRCQNMPDVPTIEEIQDFVEMGIMQCAAYEVAQHYMAYRYEHKKLRQLTSMDSNVLSLTEDPDIGKCRQEEISYKVAYDIAWRHLLPGFISEAQRDGLLYFHGASHFAERMICNSYIDLGKVINKSCFTSGNIQKPDKFIDACRTAAYVITHAFDIQYGNLAFSIAPLAAFLKISSNEAADESIEVSRQELSFGVRLLRDVINIETNEKEHRISTIINLNDAREENDRQSFVMLAEEFLNQEAADKQKNACYIPNRYIYILTDDNNADSLEYWSLTKTVINSMNTYPFIDLISEKYIPDSQRHKGWFSQGKVTINLVDAALSAGGDTKKFWDILDERLVTCHLALKTWHDRLLGVSSNSSAIMWQNGGLDILDCDKPIDSTLCDNSCSSLLLGIAGMNETCMVIRKESCNSEKGAKFAVKVIKHINDKLEEWASSDGVGYTIDETYDCDTIMAFTEAVRTRFGEVPGITDKRYLTGGVRSEANNNDVSGSLKKSKSIQEQMPGYSMCQLSSEVLCNGDNAGAVIKEIYDTGVSVIFENKADKCTDCGYEGRMNIVTDKKTGFLGWICPECGNTNAGRMIIQRKRAGFTKQGQALSQCELAELKENDN